MMRNIGKYIYRSLIFIIGAGILSFIIIEMLILIEGNKKTTAEIDYVIVLGARLYGERPSPALLERLKVAKDYLIQNKDVKVVVSGGQGPDEYIPEAQAMAKYLLDKGIEKNRVIVEDKSTNTFENLKFSLDKIKEDNEIDTPRVLIATNKHHIFRAKLLANRLKMKAYGLPAKIPPTIVFKSYIREYFAIIKSILMDK